MQYRFILWPAVSVAGLLLFSVPTPGMGQSRGTSSEGADSNYLSGSVASGHHGTSGSSDVSRHEPEPLFYQPITMSEREPVSQSPFAQNFSPDEFLTQAERDLVERVAVNVAIDPATNGVVHLHGWVSSEQERQAMAATVRDVSGVQEVVNHLQVRSATIGTVR